MYINNFNLETVLMHSRESIALISGREILRKSPECSQKLDSEKDSNIKLKSLTSLKGKIFIDPSPYYRARTLFHVTKSGNVIAEVPLAPADFMGNPEVTNSDAVQAKFDYIKSKIPNYKNVKILEEVEENEYTSIGLAILLKSGASRIYPADGRYLKLKITFKGLKTVGELVSKINKILLDITT